MDGLKQRVLLLELTELPSKTVHGLDTGGEFHFGSQSREKTNEA
jgi:hypothetical protein